MPNITEVFLMDLSKVLSDRDSKFCVCVSSGNNRYLIINSLSREHYDDFKIEAKDYDFLKHDSYVSCHKAYILNSELIIKKLGNLNYGDMKKILNKIRNSKRIVEIEKETISKNLKNG